MEFGFVYVITTNIYQKKNIYKIGCTKNLNKRITLINATRMEGDKFFIAKFWKTTKYFKLENYIHKYLKDYRKNNEFFECDLDMIENAVIACTKELGYHTFIDDFTIIFGLENKLKWNQSTNLFEISLSDFVKQQMTSEKIILEFKNFLFKNIKSKLIKFESKYFWEQQLNFMKLKFNDNSSTSSNEEPLCEDIQLLCEDMQLLDLTYEQLEIIFIYFKQLSMT